MDTAVIENVVGEVPMIQQQPELRRRGALHYGYCAYKDISLAGSLGLDHNVQPAHSPYYRNLPCRQLLPFTNVKVQEVDELSPLRNAADERILRLIMVEKDAYDCVMEMVSSYESWGFVHLDPLIGIDEQTAGKIFKTIQPFRYKLKYLQDEIDFGAPERIDATEPYEVSYNDQTIMLDPLPSDLKALARQVRRIISRGVDRAIKEAETVRDNTSQSMTNYFRGGTGKRRSDPHDKYIFDELEDKIPTLLGTEVNAPPPVVTTTESPEMIELRRKEIELRERELAIREAELAKSNGTPVKEKAVSAYKRGDVIDVEGRQAEVIDTRFGRTKVRFADDQSEVNI